MTQLYDDIIILNKEDLNLIDLFKKNTTYATLDNDVEHYLINNSIKYFNLNNNLNYNKTVFSFKEHKKILEFAKKLDLIFEKKENKFFSNYHKLISGIRLISHDIKRINFLLKKNPQSQIKYFVNNNKIIDDDRIFLILNELKSQKKKINFLYIKKNIVNNYLPLQFQEELILENLKKYFFFLKKNIQDFMSVENKKNILFYLANKYDEKYLKKKLSIFNFFNYEYFINYKYKKNTLEKKKKDKIILLLQKNKFELVNVYAKYFEKIYYELYDFYKINKQNIESFINKKKIKIFISAHPTLISNTIKDICNEKNIPTLDLMHGGNCTHFSNSAPYPQYIASNLSATTNINYFQTYTKNMKKIVLANNKPMVKKNTRIIVFGSNKFNNIIFKNYTKKNFNIGYMCRADHNNTTKTYIGFHSESNLYHLRSKIMEKISNNKKFRINISGYNKAQLSKFGSQILINKLKRNKQINFKFYNGKDVIEKSDIIIFEQFSTLLIEALYSKKKIIYLNNPYLNIFNNQKKLLSSQVLFVKNNLEINRIIDFYLKGKKNYFFKSNSDEQFIKRYYINKSNLIDKAVLKIIRDCND